MPRRILARVPLVVGMLVTTGCDLEREYVRVENDDGPGMKAPIQHVVRLAIDVHARTVVWTRDSRDARGVESRRVVTYGGRMGSTCEIPDELNWSCSVFDQNGEILDQLEMRDGHLTRFEGGETKDFQTQVRIWGRRF